MARVVALLGIIGLGVMLTAGAVAGATDDNRPFPATIDSAWWPRALSSAAGFDAASRGAILAFVVALDRYGDDPEDLKAALGLIEVNLDSVRRWKGQTLRLMVDNFRAASGDSRGGIFTDPAVVNVASLRVAASRVADGLPEEWRPWYAAVSAFLAQYAAEQMRLAARFPATTSEIATFSAGEVTGFEKDDRHFLLTFDDGPTPTEGTTDQTTTLLRENGLSGIFFVLGENLAARIAATSVAKSEALYRGMSVGVHGMNHQSPVAFAGWRDGVRATQLLVDRLGKGAAHLYRPPYGQRPRESGELLGRDGYRLVLWNIDTVDWSEAVTPDQIVGRAQLLMALWRRGILLFHDRYPKVGVALPPLLKTMRSCGVVFDYQL